MPPRLTKLTRPSIGVGLGLVVVDLVVNGKANDSSHLRAGGSCANVLTILSSFGWTSYPVARIGQDPGARALRSDLRHFGVETNLLFSESSMATPSIVELIGRSNSSDRSHSYSLTCPTCGAFLPRHRPIQKTRTVEIMRAAPGIQLFYFDRPSPAAIELAEAYRRQGAVVLFEPSGVGDERLFRRSVHAADIVKYSAQRIPLLPGRWTSQVPLEIQTLGRRGLRFRTFDSRSWQGMPAFRVHQPTDEAGSGDWCSAGIAHIVARRGRSSFLRSREQRFADALILGQALAAINCHFAGARGAMYHLSFAELSSLVARVISQRDTPEHSQAGDHVPADDLARVICAHCHQSTTRAAPSRKRRQRN